MMQLHRGLARRTLALVGPWLLALGLVATTASARASTVDIANVPLANAPTTEVKPNLMFILDDSGSMDWDFMPDWASGSFCRSGGATGTSSGNFGRACCQNANNQSSGSNACYQASNRRGHPPFLASAFNGVAYDPTVRYRPPTNADGSTAMSMTAANTANWTVVPTDAYGVQSNSAYTATNISLITQYPDTEWCVDNTLTDCLRNGNYVLPGTVNGRLYSTFNPVFATGTGRLAVGSPAAATILESRSFGPHYYRIVPGEWCTSDTLRDCAPAPSDTYNVPAPLRWCNTDANARAATPAPNSCQAVRIDDPLLPSALRYTFARYPTRVISNETRSSVTVTVSRAGTCNNSNRPVFSAVTVNGTNLLAINTTINNYNNSDIAASLRAGINNNTAATGYTAGGTGSDVVITAPLSAGTITHAVTFTRATPGNLCTVNFTPTTPQFSGTAAAASFPGSFERVDIVPGVDSYPRSDERTDCAGSTCTYAEEMTNFANWFAYYRTRMQTMKTGVSLAFAAVDERFRVGYFTLNNGTGSDFRNFDTFSGAAKEAWFTRMRAARPSGGTPLKTALSTVGRLYAGQFNGTTLRNSTVRDPIQFSCQRNFTLLSTDGYTNESGNPRQINGTDDVGDQDGDLPRPLRDGNRTANTLADGAAYYYGTDLRTSELNNCTSGSSGENVCENNVPGTESDPASHQHMTTYTLGLGVSGFMRFSVDYDNPNARGDFYAVANGSTVNLAGGVCTWLTGGSCEWPVPRNNAQTAVDDLWHAAVNGRGRYFSAGDPDSLFTGLTGMIASIGEATGAAAAATTSTPNVSTGDNFVFVSSYITSKWSGELLGKRIDTVTGQLQNNDTDWSARTLLESNTSRNIYMFSASESDRLVDFNWTNLQAAGLGSFFETAHIGSGTNRLSQFCVIGLSCLSAVGRAAAVGEPLVNFLRGDRANEGSDLDINKPFRRREFLLGDIVNSEAVYVSRALFDYVDSGYSTFKQEVASRRPVVYVGANDGMLHAFDAANGQELWAYVPTMVIPKLYRLADKNYANRHQFYVDASPVAGDAFINGQWRTLLVGGLGAGGRGYYALDVTDPANPKALWEFTNDNLGLSFGRPEITKLANGTWVVMVASGYNNTSPGDGEGRLFIIDAATGTLLSSIVAADSNNSGPASSGLAHIRAWVDDARVDNTARRVYAGDNAGNVWRFDVNGTLGRPAVRLAALRGATGLAQPITARPEIGDVAGQAMVYVGTGRYLGMSDLTDNRPQSIYAIKDPLGTTGWGNPRDAGNFVQQTIETGTCPSGSAACVAGEPVRTGSSNAVNLASNAGWYVDLPVSSERSTNDPQLALGTLVVTTNVLASTACEPDGSSFLNFFDYRSGAPVGTANGVVGVSIGNALATRPAVISLPSGDIKALTRTSNANTSVRTIPVLASGGPTRRLSWRELPTER